MAQFSVKIISLTGSVLGENQQDALKFRDWLIAKGLSGSSVTRVMSSLKAVINFATSELALETRNPFIGIYHDRKVSVVK